MKTCWTRGPGSIGAGLLAICLVLSTVVASAEAQGKGIGADALTGIVLAQPASPAEQMALRELSSAFSRLYGVKLAEVADGTPVILLGRRAALAAKTVTEGELRGVTPGGFVIKVTDRAITIAGDTPVATLYGARRFLEELGVRFLRERYAPYVPQPTSRTVPAMSIATKPAIPYRNFYSRAGEWALANKADDPKVLGDVWIDHSAGYLVPKNRFYDDHPEYYAMLKDGKRIPKAQFTGHRTPLCLSNRDVVRISIERALAWIDKQPDKIYFPISYGDTGVWCQCPDCLALDPVPGEYATRLLTWVNQVAGAIAAKHPDKVITTFAYGGSDAAPPTIRPAKNVWICGSVGFAKLIFWDHCLAAGQGGPSIEKINSWLAIAPEQVTVCEYQGKYYPCMPDTLAGKFRYYADRGIRGILFSFGHPANFEHLWKYLYPRLMWDPAQDAQALTREFALLYYGPAGRAMADYFALCHARYRDTLGEKTKMEGAYPVGFYSPDFVSKALGCFDRAREAARADKAIYAEIAGEQRAFIMDWIKHPPTKELTVETTAALKAQFQQLAVLAGGADKEKIAVAKDVHKIGLTLNADIPGALQVAEDWLMEQNFPKPDVNEKRSDGGVRIPAQGFMYDGWNRLYKGHNHPVPPKWGAAVYVQGNSANRSHRMEAHFALETIPGDGAGVLEIEGQDCDHEVDTAEIRVEVNGHVVYDGQVQMVKWNWSRQAFPVPPGVLKKGDNKVEIFNSVDPASIENWYERWFMLSEAVVKFPTSD